FLRPLETVDNETAHFRQVVTKGSIAVRQLRDRARDRLGIRARTLRNAEALPKGRECRRFIGCYAPVDSGNPTRHGAHEETIFLRHVRAVEGAEIDPLSSGLFYRGNLFEVESLIDRGTNDRIRLFRVKLAVRPRDSSKRNEHISLE